MSDLFQHAARKVGGVGGSAMVASNEAQNNSQRGWRISGPCDTPVAFQTKGMDGRLLVKP